jgi:hypothetical protein
MPFRKLFLAPASLLLLSAFCLGGRSLLFGSPEMWRWRIAEWAAFWATAGAGMWCLSRAYTDEELER